MIELQDPGRRKIVVEHPSGQIDGIAEVGSVVPEIQEGYPFCESQRGGGAVRTQGAAVVMQDAPALQICIMGCFFRGKAAKADMFPPVGQGGTAICGFGGGFFHT